jgi:hypothetical protein
MGTVMKPSVSAALDTWALFQVPSFHFFLPGAVPWLRLQGPLHCALAVLQGLLCPGSDTYVLFLFGSYALSSSASAVAMSLIYVQGMYSQKASLESRVKECWCVVCLKSSLPAFVLRWFLAYVAAVRSEFHEKHAPCQSYVADFAVTPER